MGPQQQSTPPPARSSSASSSAAAAARWPLRWWDDCWSRCISLHFRTKPKNARALSAKNTNTHAKNTIYGNVRTVVRFFCLFTAQTIFTTPVSDIRGENDAYNKIGLDIMRIYWFNKRQETGSLVFNVMRFCALHEEEGCFFMFQQKTFENK